MWSCLDPEHSNRALENVWVHWSLSSVFSFCPPLFLPSSLPPSFCSSLNPSLSFHPPLLLFSLSPVLSPSLLPPYFPSFRISVTYMFLLSLAYFRLLLILSLAYLVWLVNLTSSFTVMAVIALWKMSLLSASLFKSFLSTYLCY